MTRSETLLHHFSHWQNQHFPHETFYRDGIINETSYNSASTKILYIAKEPNASNHKNNETKSFCDEWNNTRPVYGFALRIAEWSYGILNHFPPFSTITEDSRYDSLKKIAFLNCKKTGGSGVLNDTKEFNSLVWQQQSLIRRQIEIIQPEITILCLSRSKYLRDLLFPGSENKWVDCGYDIEIAKVGTTKLIDFYHPSSRNVPAASYSLLQNVIASDVFSKLVN